MKKVRKVGGSYQHTGVVVAEFTTRAGEKRIVVEFDEPVEGMLHIFRPDQVEEIVDPLLIDQLTEQARRQDILCGHLHARRMHKFECECDNCRHDGNEPCSQKKPCRSCRKAFGLGEYA